MTVKSFCQDSPFQIINLQNQRPPGVAPGGRSFIYAYICGRSSIWPRTPRSGL